MQRKSARRSVGQSQSGFAATGLLALEERFAEFRAANGRGARVPKELRSAALTALRGGAGPGELSRRCRISWSQLDAWKRNEQRAAAGVRVFSVVDAPTSDDACAPSGPPELELRLGAWSVTVRLVEGGTR